ncbi:MAG: P1 family peptidase [Candidatus Obscuribacterales bacterium]|nr:P1 family peptidase [Candidatus Obscuribacterales bacterium]
MLSSVTALTMLSCAIAAATALLIWRAVANRRNARASAGKILTTTKPLANPSATRTDRKRLRDLGIIIGKMPTGENNAITDVPGVKVGHKTIVVGDGELVPGSGPARTGCTIILPHDEDLWNTRVSAGHFVLNGNGCVTGLDWITESGFLEGPIGLTNTHSVGDVYNGLTAWMQDQFPQIGNTDDSYLPVVGECDDSFLNDLRGRHVKEHHVKEALESATSGPVAEGAVGAGTGMSCYDFKGGIGTASRRLSTEDGGYTVGVLTNCNHGDRDELLMGGVPVGRLIEERMPAGHVEGSIVIIVATDAPLSPRQLNRLAKRASMGLARTGSVAHHSSGDFIIAFSNGRKTYRDCEDAVRNLPELADDYINPLFTAAAEATEEAVLNAICMATTTVGRDGNTAYALPVEQLPTLFADYGSRLQNIGK